MNTRYRYSVDELVRIAAQAQGVDPDAVMSRSQLHVLAETRHALMYALKWGRPEWSYAMIGGIFGRDHSTVCHGVRRIQNAQDTGQEPHLVNLAENLTVRASALNWLAAMHSASEPLPAGQH